MIIIFHSFLISKLTVQTPLWPGPTVQSTPCTPGVHQANSSWEILTRNVGHSGTTLWLPAVVLPVCRTETEAARERISEKSNIRPERSIGLTTIMTPNVQTVWFSCNYFLWKDFHLPPSWHTRTLVSSQSREIPSATITILEITGVRLELWELWDWSIN